MYINSKLWLVTLLTPMNNMIKLGVLFCAFCLFFQIAGAQIVAIATDNVAKDVINGTYKDEVGLHSSVTTQHTIRSTELHNMEDNTVFAVDIVNHTQTTLESEQTALSENRLTVVGRHMYKYGMTVLFVMGSAGNVLILLVLLRTPLGQSNVSLYLMALAMLDQLTILIAVFGSHVLRSYTGFDYIRYNRWLCKTAYFTIVTCAQSVFYLVAAMSTERALAVSRPLQFMTSFTRKRTKIIISAIVLFWSLKNAHMFWSNGAVYGEVGDGNGTTNAVVSECGLVQGALLDFNLNVRPWIDYGITFFAALVIVISNGIIIFTMTRTTILNKMMKTRQSADEQHKSSSHLIVMLVSTSITFVCLALPLQIITIIYPTNPNDGSSPSAALATFLWSFGLLTSYTNNGINFYVYLLSSREFRQHLLMVLKCRGGSSSSKRNGQTRSTEHTNSRV